MGLTNNDYCLGSSYHGRVQRLIVQVEVEEDVKVTATHAEAVDTGTELLHRAACRHNDPHAIYHRAICRHNYPHHTRYITLRLCKIGTRS